MLVKRVEGHVLTEAAVESGGVEPGLVGEQLRRDAAEIQSDRD